MSSGWCLLRAWAYQSLCRREHVRSLILEALLTVLVVLSIYESFSKAYDNVAIVYTQYCSELLYAYFVPPACDCHVIWAL
jgi:hypothetical protein